MTPPHRFPADFTWGVATSAFQIEGATTEDGRGESIWDRFCATPGKVVNGDDGRVATDHFHRWAADVDLIADLGVGAYRFSVAWPRIFPTGSEATPNALGLDFYDRLVDRLLARSVTPWVTLYHWDLPQGLQDRGGWPDRGVVAPFVRLADAMGRRLGDRVKHWITHNEPWVVAHLGHATGEHAPGLKDVPASLRAAHHVLLSHGLAVPVLRSHSPGAQVGITLNLCPADPASPSPADALATREFDGFFNRWYLDPLAGRGYPADMVALYRGDGRLPPEFDQGPTPLVQPGDLDDIAAPTDFLGINYYSRAVVRSDKTPEAENLPRTEHVAPASEWTDMGWEVHPDSLRSLLVRLATDYRFGPLVITENGASYDTAPDADGRVRDVKRQEFLRAHLEACHGAMAQGVPLIGYFAWSLMDNFEWAYGYRQRFGLVWVDYQTLERTPKDSARWFGQVARAGQVNASDS